MSNRTLVIALGAFLCVLPLQAKSGEYWVGAWASAPSVNGHAKPAEEVLTGTTLREVVHVTMGGEMVRVRFSNVFGTSPLVIGAAEIAQTLKGAAIVAGSGKALTFNHQPSV